MGFAGCFGHDGFLFRVEFLHGVYRVGTLLSSKFCGVSFEVLMLLSLP